MSPVLGLDGQDKAPTVPQPTLPADDHLDTLIMLIQTLVPLGLQAVEEVLQQKVAALAGPAVCAGDGAPHLVRWGRIPLGRRIAYEALIHRAERAVFERHKAR